MIMPSIATALPASVRQEAKVLCSILALADMASVMVHKPCHLLHCKKGPCLASKCCIKLVQETCTADSQLQANLTEAVE